MAANFEHSFHLFVGRRTHQNIYRASANVAERIVDRVDVIDVECGLISAELNRIEAERGFRVAVADLFKAMGGATPAPNS